MSSLLTLRLAQETLFQHGASEHEVDVEDIAEMAEVDAGKKE